MNRWISAIQLSLQIQECLKLSPQEICKRRNDDATTEIVESIKTRLYEFLVNGNEVNYDFMLRVLNYLRIFWKQIFAYRNDGEYRIDNSITKRAIRLIVLQRNGSMSFGSVKGISNQARQCSIKFIKSCIFAILYSYYIFPFIFQSKTYRTRCSKKIKGFSILHAQLVAVVI